MTEISIDFYSVLGISEGATRHEAHIAFQQLALRYHPDRNKNPRAEERMKQITEAYAEAMLTLPDTKSVSVPQIPVARKQNPVMKHNLYYRLNISMWEALNGVTKPLYVRTTRTCVEKFMLIIPKGIRSGSGKQFKLEGKNQTDLYVYVAVGADAEESDVYYEIPIRLQEIQESGEVLIPTSDGLEQLRIPNGTQPDTLIRMRGRGIPNNEGENGDLWVKIID